MRLFTPLLLLYRIVSPFTVHAADWTPCLAGPDKDVATIQCLVPLFTNVVVAVVELAGVALFFMFVVGGFSFLTSGGNPKQLEQAKNTLTYAILGVVVIVIAYLIIQVISAFTGINGLNKFTIPGATS